MCDCKPNVTAAWIKSSPLLGFFKVPPFFALKHSLNDNNLFNNVIYSVSSILLSVVMLPTLLTFLQLLSESKIAVIPYTITDTPRVNSLYTFQHKTCICTLSWNEITLCNRQAIKKKKLYDTSIRKTIFLIFFGSWTMSNSHIRERYLISLRTK